MVYRCSIRKSIPFTHNSKRRWVSVGGGWWVDGVGNDNDFSYFLPPCYWSKSLKKIYGKYFFLFLFYIFWRVEKKGKAKRKVRMRRIFPVCACGGEKFCAKKKERNIRNVRVVLVEYIYIFSEGKCGNGRKVLWFFSANIITVCVCWIYVVYNICYIHENMLITWWYQHIVCLAHVA